MESLKFDLPDSFIHSGFSASHCLWLGYLTILKRQKSNYRNLVVMQLIPVHKTQKSGSTWLIQPVEPVISGL